MPFDYERDDARRRLLIAYHGEFLASEVLAILERIRVDGTWNYAVLYDVRDMTGNPTIEDLKQIEDARDTIHRGTARRRGPVAFLVTDPVMYGRACAYAALAQSVTAIEVFRSRDQADDWLAAQAVAIGGQP
jgi:hypothetical protein